MSSIIVVTKPMVVDIPVTIELGRVRVAATTMIRSLMMMMRTVVHRQWRRRRTRRRTTIKRLFLATMMMTVYFTTATAMVETIDTTTRHLADKLVNMVAKLLEYVVSTLPFDSK